MVIICLMMVNNNLLGGFNPSEKYDFVSWDVIPFPIYGKSVKIPWFQTPTSHIRQSVQQCLKATRKCHPFAKKLVLGDSLAFTSLGPCSGWFPQSKSLFHVSRDDVFSRLQQKIEKVQFTTKVVCYLFLKFL